MNITITQIGLWRTEVPRQPGALARALEPLAQHGADLKVVRVRAATRTARRNIIEVYPGKGQRAAMIVQAAGFSLSPQTTLLLQGENRPGLGYAIANAIAWAGLGVSDHEAGVVDDRFSSTITFDNEEDARKAVAIIRKVIRATQPGE
jgi:hypothetical protein